MAALANRVGAGRPSGLAPPSIAKWAQKRQRALTAAIAVVPGVLRCTVTAVAGVSVCQSASPSWFPPGSSGRGPAPAAGASAMIPAVVAERALDAALLLPPQMRVSEANAQAAGGARAGVPPWSRCGLGTAGAAPTA